MSSMMKVHDGFKKLPIWEHRELLIETMQSKRRELIILTGGTGCGKSQGGMLIAVEDVIKDDSHIICTQPRKQAVSAIFRRMEELNSENQNICPGFEYRGKKYKPEKCNLLLVTHGTLLKKLLSFNYADINSICKYFEKCEMLLLDEIHERSIENDINLAFINKIRSSITSNELNKNKFPRIMLMSAIANVSQYKNYFGNIKHINIEKKPHEINIFYQEKQLTHEDLMKNLGQFILYIYTTRADQNGNMLVFLPTVKWIKDIYNQIENLKGNSEFLKKNIKDFVCYKLYQNMSDNEKYDTMLTITRARNDEKLMIILATNIAETSITFYNLTLVIDSGLINSSVYNHKKNCHVNELQLITQDSANQRAGRVGRTAKGTVVRLYTEEQYINMPKFNKPDILTKDLRKIILNLAAANQPIHTLKLMDFPHAKDVNIVHQYLEKLGAFDDDFNVTSFGKCISKYPLKPHLAALIINGGFLDDIVLLAAICEGQFQLNK